MAGVQMGAGGGGVERGKLFPSARRAIVRTPRALHSIRLPPLSPSPFFYIGHTGYSVLLLVRLSNGMTWRR